MLSRRSAAATPLGCSTAVVCGESKEENARGCEFSVSPFFLKLSILFRQLIKRLRWRNPQGTHLQFDWKVSQCHYSGVYLNDPSGENTPLVVLVNFIIFFGLATVYLQMELNESLKSLVFR